MKHRSKTTTRKIHSLMATYMLVAIGAAGILSVPEVSAADHCDDDSRGDLECSFTCLEGETLFTSGNGADNDGWVRAECKGALSRCDYQNGPPYTCQNRGTSQAYGSGSGECLGHTGGGSGNMLCGSGSGDFEGLLGLLDGLLEGGASCDAFDLHLKESMISSVAVMNVDSDGKARMFTWDSDAGCQED